MGAGDAAFTPFPCPTRCEYWMGLRSPPPGDLGVPPATDTPAASTAADGCGRLRFVVVPVDERLLSAVEPLALGTVDK